jgi:hypothetical protein
LNGIAERFNLSLLDKLRTVLLETKLPQYLWAELAHAIVVAMYLTPTSGNGNKIPNLISYKNKRKFKLRVLGSLVVAHTRTKNKLSPRGTPMYLVGYAKLQSGIRLWNPVNDQIKVFRD